MPITTYPQAYVDRMFTSQVLAQSGMPVIVPRGGTIATNGVVTWALATITNFFTGFKAWCYFPANAVSGDATGGLYYCVFSSTTQATVYQGKVGGASGVTSAFVPYTPASLTPVTGSNSPFTQTTSLINVINVPVPGGSMGPNGKLVITTRGEPFSDVTIKRFVVLFGGQTIADMTLLDGLGNSSSFSAQTFVTNRSSQNQNIWTSTSSSTQSNLPFVQTTEGITLNFGTIDTSATQSVVFSIQLPTINNWAMWHYFSVETTYGQ
jgi:hypothetical protein